jgi:MFS family permease
MSQRLDVTTRAWVRLFAAAAILLGLLARAATVPSPLFDFHSWRQADTAAIARNFVEERFNPLYPQVDHRGARRDGYVASGLELYAFVVATVARVAGFSPALGRLLNALLFPLAALLLLRFTRRRYGDAAGAAALFLYALGMPLVLFIDRAFMNESMLILLAIVCLDAAQEYCATRRWLSLAMLVLASSLIAMVKPTYLVVWGAVGGLFLERFGRQTVLRWELWLAALITMACGALWFRHAQALAAMTGLSFGLTDKLFRPDLLTFEYLSRVAIRLGKDILGPVGVAFGSYGLAVAWRRRRYAEPLGVLAFLVYLVVVTAGNYEHNYYQLPIAPIWAVLAGLGVATAVDRIGARRAWSADGQSYAAAGILAIALLSTFARSVSAHNWYQVDDAKVRLCNELAPRLLPGERVAFASDMSPDMLFCLHRKGWLMQPEQATGTRLREIAAEGAAVFVTRKEHEEIRRELQTMGDPLLETPDFVAFRAAKPTP